MSYYVYLLVSTNGSTYIGATFDLERRLRQHNKQIKGGAYSTGIKVSKGETWSRVAYISGFPDWSSALQFEWRWKQLSRKLSVNMKPLNRRFIALYNLLKLPQSTSKAKPFIEWEKLPQVHLETDEAKLIFEKIDLEI